MKRSLVAVLVLVALLAVAGSSMAAEIKLGKADFAAHGTKSFTVAVVALDGDKIVAAYIDEYQMLGTGETIGVPNAESAFTVGETWLASKKVNNEFYSNNMARAGSTVTIADNFAAIENFVLGMTVSELEALLNSTEKEAAVDLVTGATLVDTYGYLSALLAAAKDALGN